MNWTSIKIKLPADINEWSALKQPLIDIAFTLRPNKCKSTVWQVYKEITRILVDNYKFLE